jgi:hypothetical protein
MLPIGELGSVEMVTENNALKDNFKKGGINGYYSLEEERSQLRRQQNVQASSNKFLSDL